MTDTSPWYAAFPEPNLQRPIPSIKPAELAARLRASGATLVVDVRRDDFKDIVIKGAINLPAQSFYPTLQGNVNVLTKFSTVVFHCNSCTPGGRGDRCARWYQEAIDKAGLQGQTQGMVLEGGIKAWKEEFGEDKQITLKL